ncbi:MAG: DsbA family protein [Deltaproteobacteria bacterium]|nr:DsbA family protein [Deltaproteobacteria bacterium]
MTRPLWILVLGLGTGCGRQGDGVLQSCPPAVADSPVRGATDAWVTMVEFGDFECPFCGRAVETENALLVRNGADLRLVFKHLPLSFHPHAMDAAIAAACAHLQGRFWEMHDLLFAHQDALGSAELESYATQAGVDLDAWRGCLATDLPRQAIEADRQLAALAGVSGTPTYFINGAPVVGAVEQSTFQGVIDTKLEEAQASGVARADYYAGLEAQGCH